MLVKIFERFANAIILRGIHYHGFCGLKSLSQIIHSPYIRVKILRKVESTLTHTISEEQDG